MQLLNKLLIIQHFRPYLSRQGLFPYWSQSPARWYLEQDGRLAEMQAAGYELEKIYCPATV